MRDLAVFTFVSLWLASFGTCVTKRLLEQNWSQIDKSTKPLRDQKERNKNKNDCVFLIK